MRIGKRFALCMQLALMGEVEAALKFTFPQTEPTAVLDYFGDRTVYVEGDIEVGDTERFKKALKAKGFEVGRVRLNSKGGVLLEAMELGRTIRNLHLSTSFGKDGYWSKPVCYSACTMVFLGGKFRYFSGGGEFGVHRFHSVSRSKDDIERAQIIDGLIAAYLAEMGVKPEFQTLASEAASDEIRLLGEERLKALGVVNNGAMSPVWTIEAYDGALYLKGMQEKTTGPGKVTFNCGLNGQMIFSGFFGPVSNAVEIKNGSGAHSIIVDHDHFPLDHRKLIRRDEMLFSLYTLPEKLVRKVLAAKSNIGWALESKVVPGTFQGIVVDLDSKGKEKLKSFIQNCKKQEGK